MQMEPSVKGGVQATVNMVSAIPTQPLLTTGSSLQDDKMETLIQTLRQEIQKSKLFTITMRDRFVLTVHGQTAKIQTHIKIKFRKTVLTQILSDTKAIDTVDKTKVLKIKTIDATIATIATQQTSNKTKATLINNHLDVAKKNKSPTQRWPNFFKMRKNRIRFPRIHCTMIETQSKKYEYSIAS